MTEKHLEKKLSSAPDKPGVYLMRDAGGTVIYVGKAKSLRNRLRSYFRSPEGLTAKVQSLVKKIADFEYIVTDTEVEALILEFNLIKQYAPRYNIMFRDDKSYPYLKLTLNEKWPRIVVTRTVRGDGARYFGPYTRAGALRETVRMLRSLFPLRNCKQETFEKQNRACLDSHIKRCLAPCAGKVTQKEYGDMVNEVVLFMEGKQEDLLRRLEEQMREASENLEFERAAKVRDRINAVHSVLEKQKIVSEGAEDQDVIGMAKNENEACMEIFYVRGGRLRGRDRFFLEGIEHLGEEEILTQCLTHYYGRAAEIPREILISGEFEDGDLIEQWLSGRRGSKVKIHVPRRGEKRRLVEMVVKNAELDLKESEEGRRKREMASEAALLELQRCLSLPKLPLRMECYDISNISGTNSVGSMVVFENGRPKNSDYRRFKINTVSGPDDFASMREVFSRRFKRMGKTTEVVLPGEEEKDAGFGAVPDLVIVDGGRGQLSAATDAMHDLGVSGIPAIGLAKKEEEIYRVCEPEPLVLPRDSQALLLLERIRDEAHRFAVGYHRRLRSEGMRSSALDEVPGIGPKRKKALLRRFGSLENIKRASLEELEEVEGMTRASALKLQEYLGA